ncbi:antitoxin VapB family protein [Archaeoglobus sp.]
MYEKNIMIMDDVYERLKRLKKDGESFQQCNFRVN